MILEMGDESGRNAKLPGDKNDERAVAKQLPPIY